jgi:hypothetical protein
VFDEYGKFWKTDPYIPSAEGRAEVIEEGMKRVQYLATRLYHE